MSKKDTCFETGLSKTFGDIRLIYFAILHSLDPLSISPTFYEQLKAALAPVELHIFLSHGMKCRSL